TLVMVGDQDESFHRPSKELVSAIPDARLVVVPESGHTPMQEAPEAWADAMAAFFAELR
ncbi:MAG: alpha/beta hydrolase, partial [Actinobacteria bacterium]|nr:alpha/beta hydrolase [Actinomycetota bacterium]